MNFQLKAETALLLLSAEAVEKKIITQSVTQQFVPAV